MDWQCSHPRKGLDAMNVADRAEDHQARCLPYLLTLRILARGETVPLPWPAADEVTRATQAILAEARAAGREAPDHATRTVVGAGPGPGTFLAVRLSRLAAAADDAIAAARTGDFAQLRRHLVRFDSLTSAIWAVQEAWSGPGPGVS
jgi:hypothetical protein